MKNLAILLILVLASTSNVFGGISILNGLSHVYNTKVGGKVRGQVVLYNSGSSFQRVVFDLNEAVFACNENRKFVADTLHDRSASDWFSCKVNDIEIAPNSKYVLNFSFNVPNDTKLTGSFWTALMVSIEQPIRSEKLNNNIGLSTKMRYAVALIVHVNKDKEFQVDFENVQLIDEPQQKRQILVQMKNEGLYANPVEITLELYNESGDKVGVFNSKRHLIFPQVCRFFQIPMEDLPQGVYTGVLLAHSGKQYIGSNISIKIKE